MSNESKQEGQEYYVYFEQVNRQRILVEAKDEDDAQTKAAALWKKNNPIPMVTDIEPYN